MFAEPLSIVVPYGCPEEAAESNPKVKKATELLIGVRKYVAYNINKRLEVSLEPWEIAVDSGLMIGRIRSLRAYIEKE